MAEYITYPDTEAILTDSWDVGLLMQEKPGVIDVEADYSADREPTVWITRADGMQLAVGTDVEDIEDEDGEIIGQRVTGVTWTEYETDPDGSRHDIATGGGPIETAGDIDDITDRLTGWAEQGAATPARIIDEITPVADDLADPTHYDGIKAVHWRSGFLTGNPARSNGLVVTRDDDTTRDVVIELDVDEHGQVNQWCTSLWDDDKLIAADDLPDGTRHQVAGGRIDDMVRDIVPAVRDMIHQAVALTDTRAPATGQRSVADGLIQTSGMSATVDLSDPRGAATAATDSADAPAETQEQANSQN